MTARGNFSPALYWEGAGANEPIRRAHDGRLGPSLTRARHGSCRSAHPLDLSTETSECMVQRLLFCFLSLCARRIDAPTNRHMAALPVSFPHVCRPIVSVKAFGVSKKARVVIAAAG